MFQPTRQEARAFFFLVRRKMQKRQSLTGLEKLAAPIIADHPEYHALLDMPESYSNHDFSPDGGTMNPFLHLSLHLTIEEQLCADQPQGIHQRFHAWIQQTGESKHKAQHRILEILGEELWETMHNQTPFHHDRYWQRLQETFFLS